MRMPRNHEEVAAVTDRGGHRQQTLHAVRDDIVGLLDDRVAMVGVDGVDGAGKTVFAEELALILQASGVPVIRASLDDFHHPPSIRYRRGRHSPEGFYLDSYDYDALRRLLLDPLRAEGDGRIVRAIYDVDLEQPVPQSVEVAPAAGLLIVDGIFLHREALRGYWTYSIYLEVDFPVSVQRCALRGHGDPDPDAESNRRYVEGQRLYLRDCRPQDQATVVIDNTDLGAARFTSRALPR